MGEVKKKAKSKTTKTVKKKDKELTEKEKLFCQLYIKNFNAAMAARKAGYSESFARVTVYETLAKPSIKKEITRLKSLRAKTLNLNKDDIIERFMRIAFADMTDFVEFGREEVPVMTMFGPMEVVNPKTEEKEPVTKIVNTVRFKEDYQVDGGLICQIKQGKDGASIKLEDRQRALEWLANYFEMNPMDKHKKAYDNKKLDIEQERLEIEKRKANPEEPEVEDDGFVEALKGESASVWEGHGDES